jgi:hypothetical protein
MVKKEISTEARARQFLKERGLLKAFNKRQKITSRVVTATGSFQGVQRKYLIYRKNKSLVVADFVNLRTEGVFRSRKIQEVIVSIKENKFKPRIIREVPFTNFTMIERSSPINRKTFSKKEKRIVKVQGRLFMNITFIGLGKNGMPRSVTVEAGSRKNKDLSDARQQQTAWDEAFQGALSQITFSYTTFKVNWTRFSYFRPIKKITTTVPR